MGNNSHWALRTVTHWCNNTLVLRHQLQ